MNTNLFQSHIVDRAQNAVLNDAVMKETEESFFGALYKLQELAPELANVVEAAWLNAINEGAAAAWWDGFQCGRDPGRLVIVADATNGGAA